MALADMKVSAVMVVRAVVVELRETTRTVAMKVESG